MNFILQELGAGIPDFDELARILIRLIGAMFAGAAIGWQRERAEKPAGLRTHILVALGSALFVLVPSHLDMNSADISRVIQGIATGVGFLGGGVILKSVQEDKITGLTTAADMWTTAAIGIAFGLGAVGIGLICTALALIVLQLWRLKPPSRN